MRQKTMQTHGLVSAESRPFVVVVSGLPRSGTSMMMRMLEAGGMPVLIDELRSADEDNPRGYYEFERVKKTVEDSTWVADAIGKAVKMVYRLVYDLPGGYHYRLICMRRHIDEVLVSQQKMLKRNGQAGADVPDEKIAQLFQRQLCNFQVWVEQQSNVQMLEVNYNEILKKPEPVVEAVNAFLGQTLDAEKMARVVEPDLYRNRS